MSGVVKQGLFLVALSHTSCCQMVQTTSDHTVVYGVTGTLQQKLTNKFALALPVPPQHTKRPNRS